jgi:hypothetical protein
MNAEIPLEDRDNSLTGVQRQSMSQKLHKDVFNGQLVFKI